jgi:alkaline phosphatase D
MLSRRRVLELLAGAVPGLALGCAGRDGDEVFEPEAVPESLTRFPRTPMAGDVSSTRAVIALHVADDSPVTLRVWTDAEVVVDQALQPSGDGFHKVRIDELAPGTTHRYAVFSGEAPAFTERGLIGRFRTPPEAGEAPVVRIALMACIGQGTVLPDFYMPPDSPSPTTEPFRWEVFEHAGEHDLDALIHLGDQAYLDFVWSEEEGTVEAYLHAWGFYHGGGYRDIYPLAALYATWDDHESTDNADFDPWEMTPEEQQKLANAHEAWFRVVPVEVDALPIWRSFRWGDTVELVLLDCRYELEPDHQMSEEQLSFLLERIEASPCRFVCVATPKPFAIISTTRPLGSDNAQRWEGFPDDRARVAALLDQLDARHVLFVTGDIHMNYLGRVQEEGEVASEQAWEVCCTSGNLNPLADGLSADQFPFVDNTPHLPVLTFDPSAGTVHVAFYARDGALAHEQTLEL